MILMTMISTGSAGNRVRILAVALLLLAAGVFLSRGVARGIGSSSDFALIYAASHTWLMGANPYDEAAQQQAVQEVNQPGQMPDRRLMSLYPPLTFVLVAPFAIGSWHTAKLLWVLANIVFFACLVVGAARLGELPLSKRRGWWLMILLLLYAPVHTGFFVGQLAAATACCVVWSFVCLQRRRVVWAGILLGLALALKPQLAGPFLLIPLLRVQWRMLVAAGAVVGVIGMIAVGVMQLNQVSWLEDLRANISEFVQPGGAGDPGPGNPYRYQLINLVYPLTAALGPWPGIDRIVAIVGIILVLAGVRAARRGRGTDNQLLTLSLLAALSLLMVYHRGYDAILLVFPLTWSLRRVGTGSQMTAWLSLTLCLVFAVPGPSMLATAAHHGLIGPAMSNSWWWNVVILPHEGWALLLLAGVLVYHSLTDHGCSTVK